MDADIPCDGIFPEGELRELSRNLRTLIPKKEACLDEDAFRNLDLTFRRVLKTAGSARLSLAHGTAAWNCVHGFFDQGISSSDPRVRDLFFAPKKWIEVFGLFLATAPNNKSKPMKQVIATLAKVLSRNPDEITRNFLRNHVVTTTASIIYQPGGTFSIKPVFQVLEHFIDKGIMRASDLVLHFVAETSVLQEESNLVGTAEVAQRDHAVELSNVSCIQAFISHILDWVIYPDIAPAAGGLLVVFCKSLQKYECVEAGTPCSSQVAPLWANPIKTALHKLPSLLDVFALSILPGLLKLSPSETKTFLDTLPLKDLQQGRARDLPTVEIQLSLVALRECVESRLIPAYGAPSTRDGYNALEIGLHLILHSFPPIRIAALTLATSPTISPCPIPIQLLDALHQSLPHFHTETNPKIRNEYLIIIKPLCARQRRGLDSLHGGNISDETYENANIIVNLENGQNGKDDICTKQVLLEKHVMFLNWFDEFLVNELQPCASYQRHITALKALSSTGLTSRFNNFSVKLFSQGRTETVAHIKAHEFSLGLRLIRLLLDLIVDPFDDVRSTAASVLQSVLSNLESANNFLGEDIVVKFKSHSTLDFSMPVRQTFQRKFLCAIDRAKTVMSFTGRADYAEGFGRLCQLNFDFYRITNDITSTSDRFSFLDSLLSSLTETIRRAREDLSSAVGFSPLHGILIALREIISSQYFVDVCSAENSSSCFVKSFKSIILNSCHDIWDIVKPILCVDSPEGFETDESEDSNSGTGPKDTLSFAWRALKESSLLMSSVTMSAACNACRSARDSQYQDLKRIGDLAFTQLAELRHRGAFSTVSQTFADCCALAVQKACQGDPKPLKAEQKSALLTSLLEKWHRDALLIIERNASSLTRRSAGLPAIITAILGAHPEQSFFDKAVFELQAIASSLQEDGHDSGNLRLPQVHALNCLKDVFTNTLLGTATEPHMARTLDIAAGCLEVDIWAIRNCGLMLFRALLSRMHGGTDAASTKVSSNHRRFSSLVYEKYPNMPSMVLALLSSTSLENRTYPSEDRRRQIMAHSWEPQRVLPALEIIERSGLPLNQSMEIQRAIRQHMESPIWAIREKSAKTLAAVIEDRYLAAEIIKLLEANHNRQNALHGSLLCVRFMLARLRVVSTDRLRSLLSQFFHSFDELATNNKCPFTAAVYLNIIADVFEFLLRHYKKSAEDYIMSFRDCLWTQGEDGSIYHLIDIASMDASGSLLEDAVERCLRFIGKIVVCASSERKVLIMSEGRPSIVDPTSSFAKPCEGIDCHFLGDSMRCSSAQRSGLGSSLPAKFCSTELNEDLLKTEGLTNPALGPTKPTAPKNGSCHVSFGPQESDDNLRSTGKVIASACDKDIKSWTDHEAVTRWICRLSLAADEASELSTRHAAVDSIEGFLSILKSHEAQNWNTNTLLGVYVVLYDLLLDDDEDVRDKAAAVASSFLSMSTSCASGFNISMMPPVASLSLLRYISTELSESKVLFAEAACRLTGTGSLFKCGPRETARPGTSEHDKKNNICTASDVEWMSSLCILSVREMLMEARRQDNALFAVEKQNLFVDPAKEAEKWALVLMSSSRSGWVASIISALEKWTLQGLEALIENINNEEDGPLGWTSKPDVFTLGIRILQAAKVQIHWMESELDKKTNLENMLVLLRTLLCTGREKLLNGIWLQQIEDILEERA